MITAPDWLAELRRNALTKTPLLIAYSGGVDSTVLLHALASDAQLRARGLRVIHIDHGLHADSAHWAEHAQAFCDQLNVPLVIQRVIVTVDGHGPEAAARTARYGAFADVLLAGETLVQAHHRDDQSETVLLRLLRGSASAGLSGIPEQRDLGAGQLWRPLLGVGREQLMAYARAHQLTWIDDPSNTDSRFDRNFLRHELLPALRQRWPQADAALAQSAALLADDAALLDDICAERLGPLIESSTRALSLTALRAYSMPWQTRLLRYWLRHKNITPPTAIALNQWLANLEKIRTDAIPELRLGHWLMRRWRDQLWLEAPQDALETSEVHWDGRSDLAWIDGHTYRLLGPVAEDGDWLVRVRQGGERIVLPGRTQRSEVKTLLNASDVPPWLRARLPLVFSKDNELLAIADVFTSATWQAQGRSLQRL